MPPLCEDEDDFYYDAPTTTRGTTAGTPRGYRPLTSRGHSTAALGRRTSNVEALSRRLKKVQFSDLNGLELENTQRTASTHHPTPVVPKQVIHNSSARRYPIDEVELYFSEDTNFPASKEDYAVVKFGKRNDIIVGGCLDCKEVKLGLSRWKTYWAELYNGVLLLHKFKDSVEKKRELVPIGGCVLKIVDIKECLLEVHYTYQGHRETKALKCLSKADLFLWWWAIQLASVTRLDSKLLHHSMKKQTTINPFQLWESSNTVENVLFPKILRTSPSRKGTVVERPSRTRLYIVRHGETENIHFRVADKEKRLTDRGREQAAQTAKYIGELLKKAGADADNVTLIYGGLRRTVETAMEFENAIPWIRHKNECCLLEDGAPAAIDNMHRQDFRGAMHRMAHEYICRFDATETQRLNANNTNENFKILICHTSFIQHTIAQCYQISKDVVRIGAPIGHCSITEIDILKDGDKPEQMQASYTNRVQHLPLTHRTSE